MNNLPKPKKILTSTFFALLVIVLVVFIINKTSIRDKIKSQMFSASPEISALKDELDLTKTAETIFLASAPALDDNESFNAHCSSYDVDTAILGCYTNEKIYIYDVDSDELSGIVESTAAHELLHAVWQRLSNFEKNNLFSDLKNVYSENYDSLHAVLENYNENDLLNELYARAGTEIKNLPENLEIHYKKYFTNREKIVSFYNSYSKVFGDLQENLKNLSTEISALKTEIENLSSTYEQNFSNYSQSVSKFNSCAATTNCFNANTFATERKNLLNEQANLNVEFEKLNIKISELNMKISEYNMNIIHGQNLENVINSNSAPTEI